MKHRSDLKGTIFATVGLPIEHAIEFEPSGTFGAVNKASDFLRDLGYNIGSMQCDSPIGFSQEYVYIAKWYNMTIKEHQKLDGVYIQGL